LVYVSIPSNRGSVSVHSDEPAHAAGFWSQSPQIGALSPSNGCGRRARDLGQSQSPQIGALSPSLAIDEPTGAFTCLNPLKSGLCLRHMISVESPYNPDLSQSPQIGALSPSGQRCGDAGREDRCLNPLKSGLCLRPVTVMVTRRAGVIVSIPSNRGSVSVTNQTGGKRKGKRSQSPQIGALSPSLALQTVAAPWLARPIPTISPFF